MDARIPGLPFDAAALNGGSDQLLHELYLASLSPTPAPMAPAMALALSASFGSVEQWRAAFVALGQAPGGGAGWALLSFHARGGRLVNQWAADHSHASAGSVPLLVLDMSKPVDAFMQHIAWPRVHARYQQAVAGASSELGATAEDTAGARLIDVRRAGVFEQAEALAAGAEWRDPAQVDVWAATLGGGSPVVVYCVHGHEVSRSTAMRLRAAGVDARFLVGGLDGWQVQGRPVVAKSAG